MTRDEIIRMAREAEIDCDADGDIWGSTNGSLIRFAELVRQHTQIEQMPKFQELANILREKQDPMAYLDEGLGAFYWPKEYRKDVGFTPLYAHPAPRPVELTDEEIHNIIDTVRAKVFSDEQRVAYRVARAVERAHGIGEKE